jgi:hypothetical protein
MQKLEYKTKKREKNANKIDFLESTEPGVQVDWLRVWEFSMCTHASSSFPTVHELIPVNPPDLALETLAIPAAILINTVQKGVDKITC